ncbi:MAG: efflux RND transporter periplasmic adaptor subunit [Armatimonadota bacterium]|nr:efflux RND transporter periplasmic adaptor subunit [bacterium]
MRGVLPEERETTQRHPGYPPEDEMYYNKPVEKNTGRPSFNSLARKHWKRLIQLAALSAVALTLYARVSAPTSVHVTTVKTVTTAETIGVAGKVRGSRVTDLGLDVAGVIQRIYVKDGDSVSAGQLLLALGQSDLAAGARAARAGLDSAAAELDRASRGPLPSEISAAKADLAQAQAVGRAKVAQAEARLRNTRRGARPDELAEAQSELQRRQELLNKSQIDLKRTARLVAAGALAQSQLDEARTAVSTTQATVDAQRAHIRLMKAGGSADEVAEARAAIAEARASWTTSVQAARARLNTVLSNPRPEEINAARARMNQAQAEYERAIDVSNKTELRAPFSGIIADIPVEDGQSVSPGEKLMILHEMSRPIIEVETDEENLGVLAIGQRAVVTADAFPGRQLDAVVTDLGSRVNSERGTIQVLLRPVQSASWLRPDLTVDVNIITNNSASRIILPADSVTRHGGRTVVLVIRNGKAVVVPVTAGAAGESGVVVTGNLRDGDQVIRNASGVTVNSDVRAARR